MAVSEVLARWDVVVLPFPYTDRQTEKRRPALVMSPDRLHRDYGLVWALMITSAETPRWDCDIPIFDLRAAGLPAPSVLRPVKIATVEAAHIVRVAGRLAEADVFKAQASLATALGLRIEG